MRALLTTVLVGGFGVGLIRALVMYHTTKLLKRKDKNQ